jgi:hypothetical protein
MICSIKERSKKIDFFLKKQKVKNRGKGAKQKKNK